VSICVYRHIESGYVTVDSRSKSNCHGSQNSMYRHVTVLASTHQGGDVYMCL